MLRLFFLYSLLSKTAHEKDLSRFFYFCFFIQNLFISLIIIKRFTFCSTLVRS